MRDLVPKSGYYYPNRIARIYLQAMEEIVGRNGMNALLNLNGMQDFVGEYPPLNLNKEFDFADFSNLNRGLLDVYGYQGARGLSLLAGRATFDQGLKGFGPLAGVSNDVFESLPLPTKIRIGVTAIARIFSQYSDQVSHVENSDDRLTYTIERCPVCWGQNYEKPICFVATGLLEEGLRWVSGGRDHRVEEIECVAVGDNACIFTIDDIQITQ
ncbi:MAG TPA: 4-vinyl reductase [candidate division Zixibacteria bacterium]|nr:4-vinyl reductase [candidate division Zixibacteria bacterium]